MEKQENKKNEESQINEETPDTKESPEKKESTEKKVVPEKKVLDLYYVPASGPCRAVQMGAKAVGVELNLKYVNLLAKDQLKPDFIKVKNINYYFLLFITVYLYASNEKLIILFFLFGFFLVFVFFLSFCFVAIFQLHIISVDESSTHSANIG